MATRATASALDDGRDKARAREDRPHEDRVGDRLGHEEVRVDGPPGRHGQRGGQVAAEQARPRFARQQEGGIATLHQHRVESVGEREGRGSESSPYSGASISD